MSAAQDVKASMDSLIEPLREYTRQVQQLGYGSSVLDVGCGSASDTIAFARLVGKAGKVTGIDVDAEAIALANARAQEMKVAKWVQHEVGDAHRLPYADASFDSVHCARMLHHVANPQQVIAEMVRVAKPGGWVVLSDMDMSSRTVDVADAALLETEWELRKARSLIFDDAYTGRSLYRWAKQAGLQEVSAQPFAFATTDVGLVMKMGRAADVQQAAIEAGRVTAEEVAALNLSLQDAAARDELFGYFVFVVVAGRK
jgi:ubiquinone/menaquinone biosynthesis C-methylase UbiE